MIGRRGRTALRVVRAGDDLVLRLSRGCVLTVEVEDAAGDAVGRARVRVQARGGGASGVYREAGETAEDGRAVFEEIPSGTKVRLIVECPRLAAYSSEEFRIEADLRRRVSLGGRTLAVGLVVDAGSGAPVSGASIQPEGARALPFPTDDLGRFEIFGSPEQRIHALTVRADGYSVEVVEVPEDRRVRVALSRGYAVRGRVVEVSGAAAGGAEVLLVGHAPVARSWTRIERTARTGADGAFSIDGLPKADVVAGLEPGRPETGVIVYADGRDVRLVLPENRFVTGRIEGARIAGGKVTAFDGERRVGACSVAADGRFSILLERRCAGLVHLRAAARDANGTEYGAQGRASPGESGVRLTLAPR